MNESKKKDRYEDAKKFVDIQMVQKCTVWE